VEATLLKNVVQFNGYFYAHIGLTALPVPLKC